MIISAVKAGEAAEALGVSLQGLTSSVLGTAYRAKAKQCHPDHHGNAKLQQWARISWAQECLERWLKQNPEPVAANDLTLAGSCRACGGTGRVRVGTSFRPLTMECVICRGAGTVEPVEDDHD